VNLNAKFVLNQGNKFELELNSTNHPQGQNSHREAFMEQLFIENRYFMIFSVRNTNI